MPPESVLALAILASITALLLGIGLLVPDVNTPVPLRPHKHVFRLPQGSEKRSSRLWIWQNSTVRGTFVVYSRADRDAPPPPPPRRRKSALPDCCGHLDGRLFEPEGYEIEAANDGSLSPTGVAAAFASAAATWEAVVGDRFGAQTVVSESAGLVFNGRNQIGLGALDVDAPGALAVTGLWMVCPSGGAIADCPTALKISEWDQTYAIAERDWSLSGASGAYDLPSVAVHEFGHNVGLDDLTSSACEPSTMYGYSNTGETFRRSLDADTIACARALYGLSAATTSSTPWQAAVLFALALVLV